MTDNMTCSIPPALTDDELAVARTDQAPPHIIDHLQRCDYCRSRLDALDFEAQLKSTLYRFDCPDSQKLTDYALGLAPNYERVALDKHLAFCLACQEEIQTLQDFLAVEPKVEKPLSTRFSTLRKRSYPTEMIAHVTHLPAASAVRGTRGKMYGPIHAIISDEISVFLEVKETLNETTLNGQILAEDLDMWHSGLVQIFHQATLVATTRVDDLGQFECDLDEIQAIHIRITATSHETITIPELHLGEDAVN